MPTKCPKCQFENPDTQSFYGDCGTQLGTPKDIPVHTKTLDVPKEELTTGSTFAGRYQIIEELGRGGMGRVYKAPDTKIKVNFRLKLGLDCQKEHEASKVLEEGNWKMQAGFFLLFWSFFRIMQRTRLLVLVWMISNGITDAGVGRSREGASGRILDSPPLRKRLNEEGRGRGFRCYDECGNRGMNENRRRTMKALIRLVPILLLVATLMPDSVAAQSLRDLIVNNHRSYLPAGEGVFPTLLAIPGCSGVSLDSPATDEGRSGHQDDVLFRLHYPRMAERLRDAGFAVLLIDVLSAEGVSNACSGEIRAERIAQYITEAVDWARSLPYVDQAHLHLIGWSMGGWGILAWLHDSAGEVRAVRSAVAVYPGCHDRKPLNAQIPLLLLLAGSDDIADPTLCEELVQSSSSKPVITMRRYEGARHGFDCEGAPPVLDIGNSMTIGYQEEAARAAWQDILEFLQPDR